jgi:putative transposase
MPRTSQVIIAEEKAVYHTDSSIIVPKGFVPENFQRFKHLIYSMLESKPKPIKGLDVMYSLKRLSETI